MATVTPVTRYQAKDGALFETAMQAADHNVVVDVANIIEAAAQDHRTYLDPKAALTVADILVMTDAFSRLQVYLKGKL